VVRSGGGGEVHAKGTFRCGSRPEQFVRPRIMISQPSTAAVAEGDWKHKCTGNMHRKLKMTTSTVPFVAGLGPGDPD
jgi:hypothetical protein